MNLFEDYLRFNLHGILSILSGFLCLALGLMVWLKERSSKVNFAFFLFTLNAAIWIVCFGAMSLVKSIHTASQLVPIAYVFGVPFIAVHNYLFSVRIRGKEENKILLWLGYAWASLIMLWMLFRLETTTVMGEFSWGRYSTWPRNAEAQSQFWALIIPFYSYSFLGFRHLYRAYKESDANNKIRFRNCLAAFFIAYTGSVDFITASGKDIYAFGYLSLTGFTIIVAYTIIRHQLLDIRIVLKRLSLVLAIYFGLFVLLLPITIPLLRQLIKDPAYNPTVVMFSMGALIGLVFSLGPLIYAYLVRHSFWLKTNVTTGLTHELKSPLGVIRSALEVIADDIKASPSNKRLRDYVTIIDKNVTRMEIYVKDLLNLAQIQDDSVTLDKQPLNISDVTRDSLEALRPLATQKGLKTSPQIDKDLFVNADRNKIQQVISSLISNAIKFSDSGTIEITLSKTTKDILCSVADQGRGIPKDHIGKIFERFYQVSPNAKGSGIGLTIAKAWVEAHGGRIWAESEGPGKGTKITFTVPV